MVHHRITIFRIKTIHPSHENKGYWEFFIQRAFFEILKNELSNNYNFFNACFVALYLAPSGYFCPSISWMEGDPLPGGNSADCRAYGLLDSVHLSRAARSAVEKSREEVDRWLEMKLSYFPGCTAHSTSREYTLSYLGSIT